MPVINRNLEGRARALLVPLIAASDGLISTGYYGSIMNQDPRPDIIAYLGSAGGGLVALAPMHRGAARFLRDRYSAAGDASKLLEICIFNIRQEGWSIVSLPVWMQVTLDAAKEGLLIDAHEDLVDALVASGMRREMAEWRAGIRKEPPEPDWDSLSASLEDILPGMGDIVSEIRGDLEVIKNHPEGSAAGLREVIAKRNAQLSRDGGTAESRFGDVDARQRTDEARVELTGAGSTQDLMEHELDTLYEFEEEYQGAVPDEPAPQKASVHAMISRDDGLVYLHATPTDNYVGVPFIGEVLMPKDGPHEVVPVLEEVEHGAGHAHYGRVVTGLTNWPSIVAKAKLFGILIRVSDCSLEKLNEELGSYVEPL